MRLGMGLGLGNLLSGQPLTGFPNDFSFNFDGSNDYLDVNPINVDYKSISFWFRLESNATSSTAYTTFGAIGSFQGSGSFITIGGGATSSVTNELITLGASGVITAWESNSDTITGNVWHHLAIVWNGSKYVFYYDGELKDTTSGTASHMSLQSNNSILIGRNAGGSSHFNGLIDELALWDATLSADDVAKIASKPVDFSKASTYATDRTSNLKLWLRAGDKALPEEDASIARQDFYTDFDGTNDYIDIDSTGISLNDFSISGWFYHIDSTAEFQAIIALVDTGNDYQEGVVIQFYDDYFDAEGASVDGHLPKVSANTVGSGILQNSWNHFAYTVDRDGGSGGVKLYLNGALATTDTAVDSATNGNNIYIGAGYYDSVIRRFYKGYISNIAIHQTTLDAQTISQMAKSRFTPMRDNRFSVVDFDGTNDRIDISNNSALSFGTNAHTISAWAKLDVLANFKTIISKRQAGGTATDYNLSVGANGVVYTYNGSTTAQTATGVISTGSWFHYALVYSGSAYQLYINGSAVAWDSGTTTSGASNSHDIGIGWDRSGNYWDGAISSVSLYNVEKSAEEIYAIYQQGITYDESSLSGLVGYWRMGDDTSKAYPTIADSSSNSNDGTITNGASDDIVQQMVAGYDLGAFESSSEELNGEVISGSDWTPDSGITVSNGSLIFNTSTQFNKVADTTAVSGKFYKTVFTISNYVSGSARIRIGAFGTERNANGTYTEYITSTSTNVEFYAYTDGSNNFTIENISVKEVLQSADLSDTHPAIIDVNEPVLGNNVVSYHSVTDVNNTFVNNIATYTANGYIFFSGVAPTSTLFKFEYTVLTSTASGLRLAGSSSAFGAPDLESSVGTHTYYFVSSSDSSKNYLSINSTGFRGTITDILVRKVFGNVGIMTNQESADLVYSSILPDQSFLTGLNSAYNFVSLDGSNDYIKNESFTGHQQDTGTISIWVKFGDISGFQYITGVGGNTSTGTNRVITLSDENLRFSGYSADYDTGADVVADNWYHIVLIWNGTSVTFYLDGNAYTNTVSNLVTPTGTNFVVGAYPAGFGGKAHADFGTVAHWNKVLTSTEVNAIKTLGRHGNLLDSYSDNLKLCYSMSGLDAKTGFADTATTIYDRSGNSNHGTTVSIASSDLKSSPNAQPEGYAKGDTNRSTTTP